MTIPRQQPSILIVEDERIVAKDIQQMLQEFGYDAFAIASSAEQAMVHASKKCPDLVLMDIRIKGGRDGLETAELFRTKFDVPVVYLTAHADDATIDRAKKTEPYGYILKPVKPAELRSVIEVSLYKHQIDKRQRERERWWSTTLQSIGDAVIAVDLAGNVMLMNPTAEALTGASVSTALGKPVQEVLRFVNEQEDGTESPIVTALREGRLVEIQEGYLINQTNGARHIINDSAAPVRDAEKQLGAVMVFRDVTEQKRLEKQLELADRLASLGTMAAGLAHEINNPLTVVLVNAGVVSKDLKDLRSPLETSNSVSGQLDKRVDEMLAMLADIESAATRIGRICADLRSFSRPAARKNDDIDVAKCIDWAVRATAHEVRFRAKLVKNLVPVPRVNGDEAKLGQVFVNLLVNAAHAISPGATDRNEIRIESRTDARGFAVIEVRDTGCGITPDILGRIFDPFFTTKAVGVGTGLGLSICHGIVTSLRGEIQVESEVGRGTTVRVSFPPALPAETMTPSLAEKKASKFIRGRILLVDDEKKLLGLMARLLGDHDISCFENARDALALINQGERFDLILTDITMPMMTGIEFYEELLASKPELARRVVFLSGGAISLHINDFLQSVPNQRIDKPFGADQLRETVQKLLAEQAVDR